MSHSDAFEVSGIYLDVIWVICAHGYGTPVVQDTTYSTRCGSDGSWAPIKDCESRASLD